MTIIKIINGLKKRSNVALQYKNDFRTFQYTYKQLYKQIRQFASYLRKKNVKKGDRVLIWGPNSPSWVIAHLGTIYAGAVSVPADMRSTPEVVVSIARSSKPKFIVKTKFRPALQYKAKTMFIENLEFDIENEREAKPIHNDLVQIVYTSGTTGKPKGVMLTHENIVSNLTAIAEHIEIRKNDHMLSLLPLSHLFEQTCGLMAPLASGGKVTYIRSLKPSAIFGALEEEEISILISVPRLLQSLKLGIKRKGGKKLAKMLKTAKNLPRPVRRLIFKKVHKKIGKRFRFFISGGSALDSDTEKFWKVLGFKVLQGYGLTECAPVVTANKENDTRSQSVGCPLSNVQLKIASDSEVLVRGPNVFRGYYKNRRGTAAVFSGKWFKTGDIGAIEDGFLYIKGRKKDTIITAAGMNVYPEDIESKLNEFPEVDESCVIGLPIEGGEEVHAVLLTKKNPQKIIDLVNEQLDSSQQIMSYTMWNGHFPKTSTLKIRKNIVKEFIQRPKKTKFREQSKLERILSQITKRPISQSKRLYKDLGIDSMGRVELVSLLEEEYNIDFNEELINDKTTVKMLESLLKRRTQIRVKSIDKLRPWAYSLPMRMIRTVHDFFVAPIWRRYVRITVKGKENLRDIDEPVVFVSNHVSFFDTSVIEQSLPFRMKLRTLAAMHTEFFEKKGKGFRAKWHYYYSLIVAMTYPFPRTRNFRRNMIVTGGLLDQKRNIIFFPEGKHTLTGRLQAFKPGIGFIVSEMRVPVVPMRIDGIFGVINKGIHKKNVTLNIGKPISFTTESRQEITETLQQAVKDA